MTDAVIEFNTKRTLTTALLLMALRTHYHGRRIFQ